MSGSSGDYRQYVRAITKRLWLVVLLAALAAGGMYLRVTSQPAKYSAEATLMVTASSILNAPTSSLEGSGPGASSRQPNAVFNDIIHLLSSRSVKERVAKEMGLSGPSALPGNVTATQIRGTDLVKVRATASDRDKASRLANVTAEQLIAYFRELNRRDMRDIRLYIEQQLDKARQRLVESDRAVQAYKERHRIVDIATARSQASNDAAAARTEREAAMLTLRENEARLEAARAKLGTEKLERTVARTTRENPVFVQLQSRLTALEIQRAESSQVFTAQHPRMKQLEGELATVRQQMLSQVKTVLSDQTIGANPIYETLLGQVVTLEVDRAAAKAKVDALAHTERRRQAGLMVIPGIETGFAMLTREQRALEESYTMLAQRHQEALLRENEAGFVPAGVQVMEPAIIPTAPVEARLPVQTGVAGLVGLLLGMMAAIFLETSDDRIRSPQDAERVLGAPVLVEVPDMSTPRAVPGGVALLVALVFGITLVAGGSLVAARVVGNDDSRAQSPVSMLVRLGQGIDHAASRLGQAIR